MTGRQRIVLLLIAVVILAGGIALAASSGDDDGGSETTANTTVAPPGETSPETPGETQGEPPPAPKPRVETIRIRDGGPVGGEKTLEYERGDTIRLRFVSDAPGEVHIHGFDRYVDVGTRPQVTRFTANLEGIFEVEEHGSGEILAKLEIRPK